MSQVFESEGDLGIEFYEFLDLLLILRALDHPLNNAKLRSSIKRSRSIPVERPWTFDDAGNCSMPVAYKTAHTLFDSIDRDHDGHVTKKELYGIVITTTTHSWSGVTPSSRTKPTNLSSTQQQGSIPRCQLKHGRPSSNHSTVRVLICGALNNRLEQTSRLYQKSIWFDKYWTVCSYHAIH